MAVVIVNDSPEDMLADHLTYAGIEFIRQHKPFRPRQFAVDFYIPAGNLLVEVQGGVYQGGVGHNSVRGILRDIEKLNLATLNGYRYLQVVSGHIESGEALSMIERVIASATT